MKVKNVPTFLPTSAQREWIEEEKKRTGNSFSTIMKDLIQKEVNKSARSKK